MNIKLGLAIIDGLLFIWLIQRLIDWKRRVRQFRPGPLKGRDMSTLTITRWS